MKPKGNEVWMTVCIFTENKKSSFLLILLDINIKHGYCVSPKTTLHWASYSFLTINLSTYLYANLHISLSLYISLSIYTYIYVPIYIPIFIYIYIFKVARREDLEYSPHKCQVFEVLAIPITLIDHDTLYDL